MHTALDCVPCFARQALGAARHVTNDPRIHERILRDTLHETAKMDFAQGPPALGQIINRLLRKMTGVEDPYRAVKDDYNKMALAMLPELERRVLKSPDPLRTALRLAIAGNAIDLGANSNLTEAEARQSIACAESESFHGDLDDFRHAVTEAQRILYLADNAGEIVFDRLLIQQLPTDRVTVAVRGSPVLNDATRRDAEVAGLCEQVEVIDNGSDAPGTILEDCNDSFRRRFEEANLIISKGQGNFETLSEAKNNIYFLFKAKCHVIANLVGVKVGVHVAIRRKQQRSRKGDKRCMVTS